MRTQHFLAGIAPIIFGKYGLSQQIKIHKPGRDERPSRKVTIKPGGFACRVTLATEVVWEV